MRKVNILEFISLDGVILAGVENGGALAEGW
jgi:hypothetical protein